MTGSEPRSPSSIDEPSDGEAASSFSGSFAGTHSPEKTQPADETLSFHEAFFQHDSFVVVGHQAARPFPMLSYSALLKNGKKVFAVDPSQTGIGAEPCFDDLEQLPEPVQAALIEVPAAESQLWVERCAKAGIRHVWLHMKTDSPEAHRAAEDAEIALRTGTCAVQYLDTSFPHNIHRLLRKGLGRW